MLSWGSNELGQHGHPEKMDTSLSAENSYMNLEKVKDFQEKDNGIMQVSCGTSHSAILTGIN